MRLGSGQQLKSRVWRDGLKAYRRVSSQAIGLLGAVLIALFAAGLLSPAPAYARLATLQQVELVAQEIRYQVANAQEVFLVWGINGWANVPEAQRPAGTVVNQGLMYTPMRRDGGSFSVQLQLPDGATIDYVFKITTTQGAKTADIWDTNAAAGRKDYHTIAQPGGVAEVTSAVIAAQMQPSASHSGTTLVSQEIRYQMAEASEVVLVWGINGWTALQAAQQPAGTVIQDQLMYTPMVQAGDSFAVKIQVPPGSTIDYVFKITRTTMGAPAAVWDANGDPKQDYHTAATEGGMVEVRATPDLRRQLLATGAESGLRWRWLLLLLLGCGIVSVWVISYIPGFQPGLGASSARYLGYPRLFERITARLSVLPIVIILILAAALRLYQITQPFTDAFSWRETSVAMMAENYFRNDWNIFYPAVSWSGPGPGYQGREFQTVSYISALLYLVVGQADWVGRSVALLFGVWGIFALYRLVRRVWDEEHALAAAAIMAVLPGGVLVDRSFLPDPAMVALVVTSFWMLVAYLQTERSRYLLIAGLIGAWGFCTKIPGLIVGLPMAYAALAILGRRIVLPKKLAALAGFGVLSLVPVIAYYLWARHLALTYPPYHFAGDGNWLWQDGLVVWLEKGYFLAELWRHFNGWIWTAPIIVLVTIGVVARPPVYTQDTEHSPRKARWVFHWWLFAGLIYYGIGAQELTANPWNFHILNPAAAVLAGHALVLVALLAQRLLRRSVAPAVSVAILASIIVFGQAGLKDWYQPYSDQSYRMGRALSGITQPGELVVTIGHSYGDPVPIYYSQRRGWGFPPADPAYAWDRLPADDSESILWLEDLRAKGGGWLAIVNEHRQEIWQQHTALARQIERTCELKAETDDYVIFRMLSPSELANLAAKP
jgi:4-amino-4-deoxy-L-arabinose transferase-like glycosyltransferase